MEHSPGHTAFILDENGCIARSIPCINCQYDLRGLDPAGACPECGESIERTVYGSRLHFADTEWLDRMRSGCMWLTIGLIVHFCSPNTFDPESVDWGAVLWNFIVTGMKFFGVWQLTSPEPTGATHQPAAYRRGLIRVIAIVAAIYYAFPFGMIVAGSPELHSFLLGVSMLLFACLVWLITTHLATYAPRIPDSRIGKTTTLIRWALTIAASYLAVIAFLAPWFGTTQGGAGIFIGPYTLPQSFFFVIGIPVAITLIVGFIVAILTLWIYRGAFKRAATFAREASPAG